MYHFMFFQISSRSKRFFESFTLVRSIASVISHVNVKVSFTLIRFAATNMSTLELCLFTVVLKMFFEMNRSFKSAFAIRVSAF